MKLNITSKDGESEFTFNAESDEEARDLKEAILKCSDGQGAWDFTRVFKALSDMGYDLSGEANKVVNYGR